MDFIALIEGQADLQKAKKDFDSFKTNIQNNPIKLKFDTSGLTAAWNNIQNNFNQQGQQAGNAFNQGFKKNIASIDTTKVADHMLNGIINRIKAKNTSVSIFGDSALKNLGADSTIFKALEKELDSISQKGLQLQSLRFNEDGTKFIAKAVNDMGTLVTLTGKWKRAVAELDNNGNLLGVKGGYWENSVSYATNFTAGVKQAQTEAKKLANEVQKVKYAMANGNFDAQIAKMEQGLMNIGKSAPSDLVKKASDAAAEYYKIVQEIQGTINGTAQNPLNSEQLVNSYKKAEQAAKTYNNAMVEVRANSQKMLADGVGERNANQVEAWAKKNSRALRDYGKQLDEIAQKMRAARTEGELNDAKNQFKNLTSEINAAGKGGLSFADQIKKAFTRIGEFTFIYALTSQMRQLPQKMAQEVIKIDTAMTELRKVSTASMSEISDYFDKAADSAYKYGQSIDSVINSTASWTRLGYDLKDASILTDVSAELAKVGSGLNVDTATEGLQATLRGFGMVADEAKRVGDMINYIADTQPIDALGIINGLERSSAAMREANNSLEETVGLITASTSVTQDATSAGTAWRTVALRIRGAKSELEEAGLDTEGMVESTSKLRDEIMALSGVDILEADGETFKSTYKIIEELSKVWKDLSDISRANILELIAGKRGSVPVSAALQNFDIARSTMQTAMTDSQGSMDKQLEIYNQSIQASIDKFHVAFQQLSQDIVNSEFLKSFIDAGTMILHIIDELVNHIGVLGTAIVGLGGFNIVSTFVRGAREVRGFGEAAKLAFETFASKASTATDKATAFQLALSALKDKFAGGANATGGLISGLFTNPALIAGAAIAASGAILYSAYKKQQEELRKQATEATKSWNDTQGDVSSFKDQYTELNDKLTDANITEAERIGIKQQLLDLQTQINAKYGDQVKGIDLVNGELNTQLGILDQISEESAKRSLRENNDAYMQSVNQMTKKRTYTFTTGEVYARGEERFLSDDTKAKMQEIYADLGFKQSGAGFVFTGDASQADNAIDNLIDRLYKLKETVGSLDADLIQGAINIAQENFDKNYKVLSEHQDNYKSYLEQSLFADGYGYDLSEYARRVQSLNEAVFSEDEAALNKAKDEYYEYFEIIKGIVAQKPEYKDLFQSITDSVDDASWKFLNFKDVVDGSLDLAENGFVKYKDGIDKVANMIKSKKFDKVDIQQILGGTFNGDITRLETEDLKWLARVYGVDLSNENEIANFADILVELGVAYSGVGEGAKSASESMDQFFVRMSGEIESIDKVNAALVNSFASGGLSISFDKETGAITGDISAIISAYKDLDGYDAKTLFERTADGIIVNRDALRALQAQQEAETKSDFYEKRKQLTEQIIEAENQLRSAEKAGQSEGQLRAITSQIDALKQQRNNLDLLSAAYDGATSAYQKWLDAQQMGEAGDQYDKITDTALKRGKELRDAGLVGTNEFRAIAQLYSNEDLSLATIDEIVAAYDSGVKVVKKYFTEGQDGAVAFADKLVELGAITKDGDYYDFTKGFDTQKVADELGISVDLVEAAVKKLGDYGFDVHFLTPEQVDQLDTLSEKAESAKDRLKELADEEGKINGQDVSSVIDIDVDGLHTVKECDEALDKIDEVKPTLEVDSEEYKALEELEDSIIEKQRIIDETSIGGELNYDNLSAAYSVAGSLVTRINQINSLRATTGVDIDVEGDDEVNMLAEQISAMPDEIKKSIGFDIDDDPSEILRKIQTGEVKIPAEFVASGTVDTPQSASVDVTYNTTALPTLDPITVDVIWNTSEIEEIPEQSAKVKYTTSEIEEIPPQTATINYRTGNIPSVPSQTATLNYKISIDKTALDNLPETGTTRHLYYQVHTSGGGKIVEARGTVSRSAFSNLKGHSHARGIALKHDENALINELGAEVVVRPSDDEWFIFNGGKPTMGAPLRRGDIIFNAQQSKELLERGWTDDIGRLIGGAYAGGTARATAVGGGKFYGSSSTKKKNTSSGSSGNSGSGSNNNSSSNSNNNSNDDAKDFSEILDEIEIKIDRIERGIKNLDAVASNTFNTMIGRSGALSSEMEKVAHEIDVQRKGYVRYLQQMNSVGLSESWRQKVKNGAINIEEVKDEDLWKKIDEYRKWYELAIDCRDAIVSLQVDEADLWNQRFELSQTQYENEIEQYQHLYDVLDNYVKYADNRGRISSNLYYQRQIDAERKKIEKLNAEYDSLTNIMRESLASGKVAINSEGYYDWLEVLNDICESISDAETNIEELNSNIRETEWDIFDKLADSIERVNEELDFLYGLLGNTDKFFDDKGHINENGITGFGVLASQYNVALQGAQKYAEEIEKINKQLATDKYNQDLIERQNDLYEGQRKLIDSANDYRDSMVDLVEKGIQAQVDSLKDLIKNYTDLMDTQKDEIDYAKKVSDAQANINKLEKQLNAYANDNSEEGATRRQRLRTQLADARQSLEQTQEERRIAQTKQMLNELQEEYEEVLNSRLDNIDALIEQIINGVDANAMIIKNTVEEAASEVGYMMTDYVDGIFGGNSDLVSYFTNGDFVNKVTNISDAVNNIESYLSDAAQEAEREAASRIAGEEGRHSSLAGEMNTASAQGNAKVNSANKISGVDGNWVATGGHMQWQNTNGSIAQNTWSQIDGKWYRFDENGNMMANMWYYDKGQQAWYHLGANGVMEQNKWIKKGSDQYYLDGYGRSVKGWQNLSWSGGKDWFLFDDEGRMLKGLQNVGGKNYFLDTTTGTMVKNKWMSDGKYWRYFDDYGRAKTGWFYDSSAKKWAYLDPSTGGGKLVSQWYYDPSQKAWYWLDESGWMVKDGRFKTSKGMSSFDGYGRWLGYKKGTRAVGSSGLYWTNEDMPETIIRKSDGAVLTRLNTGDTVINGKGTQNLWDFSNDPKRFLNNIGFYNHNSGGGNEVNMEFNLSGLKSPSEFMNALLSNKKFEKLIQEITLGRANGHGVLAKNAIRI